MLNLVTQLAWVKVEFLIKCVVVSHSSPLSPFLIMRSCCRFVLVLSPFYHRRNANFLLAATVYTCTCHTCITLSCRDYGDGVVEMSCTFEKFDIEILKTPLPYKYVVYSPKVKKSEENYEYLHAHSSWRSIDLNRCLVIPAGDRHFPTGITTSKG
jgi:hypothetical protein